MSEVFLCNDRGPDPGCESKSSDHVCQACGSAFTVTPAVPADKRGQWLNCLADTCPSYDITRDVDMFFEPMADVGLIERRRA